MEHLNALQVRLSHERGYLAAAKSKKEREIRKVWIAQIEKEIAHEMNLIGGNVELPEMSDDELMAALGI